MSRGAAGATELLTIKDFASALALSDAAIRKWVYQGRLEPVKLGRSVRLRRRDLDRLVNEGLNAKTRRN
jgi:excisionase family DNA binding protein